MANEANRIAELLLDAWKKADPKSSVALHSASYVATFADMAKAIIEDRNTRPAAPVEGLVENCDGKEQEAFEAWAKKNNYDMHEHPMHYLFLDAKTYAARQGWNEAIRYCRSQAEAIIAAKDTERQNIWFNLCNARENNEKLVADNEALTARVKELELSSKHSADVASNAIVDMKALEPQLAAAKKALADIASHDLICLKDPYRAILQAMINTARAALEVKP